MKKALLVLILYTGRVSARERINFDFGYVAIKPPASRSAARTCTDIRILIYNTSMGNILLNNKTKNSLPHPPSELLRLLDSWRHKLGNNIPPPSPSPYPTPSPPPPPAVCNTGVETGYNWGDGGRVTNSPNATECCAQCNADSTCGCWDYDPVVKVADAGKYFSCWVRSCSVAYLCDFYCFSPIIFLVLR